LAQPELSNAFKIVSIPTIVVIKNGEIIDSVVGYRPKEDITTKVRFNNIKNFVNHYFTNLIIFSISSFGL